LTHANNSLFLLQARLARSRSLAPEERDALRSLVDEALGAHDRIQRTIATLRPLGSPHPRERAILDAADLVAEATRLFALTHVGRVEIERDFRDAGRVMGDRVELQQVVLNLLQNAADAAGEGGRIAVRVLGGEGVARIVVEDDGPGVPDAIRGRIFEPFFTTKPHGTGLGLSVVRRIVETHGARIAVGSREPRGTRFEVAIPVAQIALRANVSQAV
jgi:signal transduction histidine kinase